MAFDLCVIPASVVPYLSALQTRKFSITDITAHLVSEKLTREQCRLMTHDTFTSSYGSSSHALHVRSSVSSEINLAITSSVSGNAPSGYTIVIQGCLNDHNSPIVLGVCVSDEPIVADASLRMFVNIEETNNVFRLRADFDGMVTQGLLDDILYQSLEAYPTIALYNSSTKKITFKNASKTELPNMEIDASAFIKDGMVNSDNEYSKTFAGVWDGNSVDTNTYSLSNVVTQLSDQSDNVLVGLSNSSSKLVPLLVDDACNGAVTINPNLDWDSPVYVLFAGYRCFSAHPLVDFRQVLKYDKGSFMFTFSPRGSETPSVADGDDGNQYFGSANYPVFISDFCGSYKGYKSFCVGVPSDVNIPSSDLHWRLLGYTTSKPGYIRLTESHPFLKDFIHQIGGYVKLSKFTVRFNDASYGGEVTPSEYVVYLRTNGYTLEGAVSSLVSNYGEDVFHIKDLNASWSPYAKELNGEVYVGLPSMTTVEFKDRVSFRTSTDEAEVAYIDSAGVYHGRALEAETSKTSVTSDTATRSNYATELNVSNGGSTLASFTYGSNTWDTDKGINPTSSNTLSLGSTSNVWKDVYGYTLHALGNSASSGLRLCDGNYESIAYSSITGCKSAKNGQMKFHHYNAYNDIDYVVTSTGPNTTDTLTTAATLRTEPQSTGTWTLGSSSKKLASVYANTFYGDLSGNASTATQATKDGYGNIITSTYISDISVDSSSMKFYTYTATGTKSSVPVSGESNTALTLKKGSSTSSVTLNGLVANIIAGTDIGSVRWVCFKTTGDWSAKKQNIYMSGTTLHSVDMTTSPAGDYCIIRFNAIKSMTNQTLTGVWRLLNYVGEILNGNMIVALAVRVY